MGGANCDDSKRYWFLLLSLFPEILHKAYERVRSRQKRQKFSNIWRIFHVPLFNAEAEFVDIVGTKVFPPCYSQSPLITDSNPSPSLEQQHCIRKPQVWELSKLCLENLMNTQDKVCWDGRTKPDWDFLWIWYLIQRRRSHSTNPSPFLE